MPVHQLSRRSRDGPISAIYGGRPADDKAQKYYWVQNMNLRQDTEQEKRHAVFLKYMHQLGQISIFGHAYRLGALLRQIIFSASPFAG